MKAFVTGGTGFVGSHLIDRLLAKNVEVFALKRKTSDTKWLDAKKINYVEGDLFSDNILKDTIKNVDYVFHVAGVIKAKNYTDYERGNNIATKKPC
jgi:Nucleoside-diphosphate-sugar epimerases